MLHKKDRGRPTEAMVEESILAQRKFGELEAKDFIPGAEVVELEPKVPEKEAIKSRKRKRLDSEYSSEESGSDWEDVYHSSDNEEANEEENATSLEERKAKAIEVTSTRILTDADFKRIDAAQLRKQVQGFSRGKNKKRRLDEDNPLMSDQRQGREELVDLANIEMIHKKRKHDKESRLATVLEGREDREKFGSRKGKVNEFASTTHKEKAKKKNFMMMKHKLKFKTKRSFVEKQAQMRKSMLRSKKFK